MKYLIVIGCIIGVFSLAAIVSIWPEKQIEDEDVVITVNNLKITRNMLDTSEQGRSSHHANREDYLNSVIVEQILIQEAQKQNIDKEPAFRQSLKNYYEQSLVNILLERQNQTVDVTVSDEEIDSFISYFGKTITFTVAQGSGESITPEIDWADSTTSTVLFDDLSSTLQPIIAGLQPGNTRTVFDTGNEWFAVKVESIEGTTSAAVETIPKDMIRKIIATHKREQQLNAWINRLIAEANISIKEEE